MNIDQQTIGEIAKAFALSDISLIPFGKGHINQTWKLSSGNSNFILQQLNRTVFKHPYIVASNVRAVKQHLQHFYPEYLFVAPIDTINGQPYFEKQHSLYRLFPFIEGSVSHDVATTPGQAYQAARQFGKLTRMLTNMDIGKLAQTIPGFHDLSLKFSLLLDSAKHSDRLLHAKPWLEKIEKHKDILSKFNVVTHHREYIRVVHHDCKINNVLFNRNDEALCVIDLDTLMPGFYISDTGDMMRTYICPVDEEEKDLEKIMIRTDYYKAIEEGYLEEMAAVLSEGELELFHYSGSFMIYLQAIRFLDDYLRHDQYYPVKYTEHNLDRAKNQLTLLERYIQMENKIYSNPVNFR